MEASNLRGYGIAVIGMALRFPKASSPEEFWSNIVEGRNCIEFFKDSELLANGVTKEQLDAKDYVKVKGGIIDSVDEFDAELFHYSESEAQMMEPQMRLFHEVVWEALEHAGYNPYNISNTVGIYAGATQNLYWQFANIARQDDTMSNQFMTDYLINPNYIPTRLSYNFGFRGPSVFQYTACSSSLVSIHTACRALLGGECKIALAGGSSVLGDYSQGYTYQDGMILSPDGQCRAFDETASGTVPGEGIGILVLKKYEDAKKDGDKILGIIRSSAVNNDGNKKIGFSAPSIFAQADVIKTAMTIGEISPGEVSYVETHGTGTPLGDSVEIEGLKLAMESMSGDKKCTLGSLKPNIGHLDAAAGVASVIKVLLALNHRVLPPMIQCDHPMKELTKEDSKFQILHQSEPWENGNFPLVAGVSAFGIGGTNAHVILEEAPHEQVSNPFEEKNEDVILFSERSKADLDQLCDEMKEFISHNFVEFRNFVSTLKTGRYSFPIRRMILAKDYDQFKDKLAKKEYRENMMVSEKEGIVLLISGLDGTYDFDGHELYQRNYHFQGYLKKYFDLVSLYTGIQLSDVFLKKQNSFEKQSSILTLLNYCIAATLVDVLKAYSVQPSFVVGDGLGELIAAYAANQYGRDEVVQLGIQKILGLLPDVKIPFAQEQATKIQLLSSRNGEVIHGAMLQELLDSNCIEDGESPKKITDNLISQQRITIIELGPGGELCSYISNRIKEDSEKEILFPLKRMDQIVSETGSLQYTLGVLWLKGVDINWKKTYAKCQIQKVNLPGVHFKRRNYKMNQDVLKLADGFKNYLGGKEKEEVLYTLDWKKKNHTSSELEQLPSSRWLIFQDNTGLSNEISDKFSSSFPMIVVEVGDSYEMISDNHFMIRADRFEDYDRLFFTLKEKSMLPTHILHSFSNVSEGKTTKEYYQEIGFYSLLYLAKALANYEQSNKTVLNILTQNLYRVCDEPYTAYHKTIMSGPMKVIPQEFPSFICRNIDIDTSRDWKENKDIVLDMIREELLQKVEDAIVAFRGKRRWVQEFNEITPASDEMGSVHVTKNGNYIVIGGLGEVGFSIASLLASKYQANLIITGRSELDAKNTEASSQKRIERFEQLKKYNTNVSYYTLDVTDKDAVNCFFEQVRRDYTSYDGVIYSAGLIDGPSIQFIQTLKREDCEQQFQTKVNGPRNVINAIGEDSLRVCLFVSSISSILGGMQFAAYTGANSFLDAYILEEDYKKNHHYLVVDWDWMDLQNSMQTFERILSLNQVEQVLVSTGSRLRERYNQWINRFDLEDTMDGTQVITELSENVRNMLTSDYQAPTGAMEENLVQLWQKFFGVRGIGVRDSFLELGGDSLKALTILSIMHKELNVKLSIQDFYKNLTIEKLAKLVAGHSDDQYQAMSVAKEKEFYPLSPGQKRMYVLWKLDKKSIAYNQTHVLNVNGELDIDRLKQALTKLTLRHDAFRTSLVEIDSKPFMRIETELPLSCQVIDVDESKVDEAVKSLTQPFNLLEAPLYRINILKVRKDYFVLIFDFHHILVDGVSIKIIIRELMEIYCGDELEYQKYQYKDYCEWLNEKQQQERIQKEEEYWCNLFKSEVPLLQLRTDYQRPKIVSYRGDTISFSLSCVNAERMMNLAKKQEKSLFTFLISSYFIMLYKLTGQNDIVVGTPIAGRDSIELSNIVGFFVNTLPMKAEIDGNQTFHSFIDDMSTVILEAFSHQLYPFDELVKKVGARKLGNRNPIFDTMFVFQNMMDEKESQVEIPSVVVTPYVYKNHSAQFDLTLVAEERDHTIAFEMEYSTDLFKRETIEKMKDYFLQVIDVCLENEEVLLKDIPLLSKESENRLMESLHKNYPYTDIANSIQEIFEKQVMRYPDNVALKLDGTSVTYRELNERANRLAHYLQANGIQRNTIVGMLLSPSMEQMVSILGILKAGGVYLPLDPMYPKNRIEYILSDSKVKHLIVTDDTKDVISDFEDMTIYNLDHMSTEDVSNPQPMTEPQDGAYIIYTSGTTGTPKGVYITHHNVMRLFFSTPSLYDFTEKDRWIMCHSYCFDFSVWEIFGALLYGGTLIIIQNHTKKDTRDLLSVISREGVTVLNQTPSAFVNLQTDILKYKSKMPIQLRYVIFGGEKLLPYFLKEFKDEYPQTKLINMYGITEITVHATYKEITEKEIKENSSNIGVPIPTLNLYLMDSSMKLVPPGVYGEIYVGGEGVSKGYVNKAELTKERFLKNPYDESEIIYKSGDLGFINEDGDIIYIGRNDSQIQLRGFRVETEEIVSCLLKNNGIQNAFVYPQTTENGYDRLVAYLKLGKELMLEDIKEELRKYLPDYMIPAIFYKIKEIPLTSNNKIDVHKLESIREEFDSTVDFVKPVSNMEKKILEIWKKVLKREEISIKENFFEIGGDSLNAIQVILMLESELNREVPPVTIFTYYTIESLSSYIEKTYQEPEEVDRQDIIDRGRQNRQKRLNMRRGKE